MNEKNNDNDTEKLVQFDDKITIIKYKSNQRIIKKNIFKKFLERLKKLRKKQ